MAHDLPAAGDSARSTPGEIPGTAGAPAFVLSGIEPSPIPVLLAVPHSGRGYTRALLARMRDPARATPRLEDRYVDRLARAVAKATGAMLLVAHAPRAMIDLNRAPDDIDWDMIEPTRRGYAGAGAGRRARTGLGLVPRRLPVLGELWTTRLPAGELDARIAGVHSPYHACLGAALARLRSRWGAALLIDLHSMPSLVASGGSAPAELVVGDRFGASCAGALVAECFAALARDGRRAAHNRPYAGGYVLDRHADPAAGIHALQLEIDRARYLDAAATREGPGFPAMVATLTTLVRDLAAQVAALAPGGADGDNWAEAAE